MRRPQRQPPGRSPPAPGQITATRIDEAGGYLENLLVGAVSRTSWLAARLGLASLLLATAGIVAGGRSLGGRRQPAQRAPFRVAGDGRAERCAARAAAPRPRRTGARRVAAANLHGRLRIPGLVVSRRVRRPSRSHQSLATAAGLRAGLARDGIQAGPPWTPLHLTGA